MIAKTKHRRLFFDCVVDAVNSLKVGVNSVHHKNMPIIVMMSIVECAVDDRQRIWIPMIRVGGSRVDV